MRVGQLSIMTRCMFKKSISLIRYSNYKIGGPADFFYEAKTVEGLEKAVKQTRQAKLPFFVLGGGTNLLISDSGYHGLVLKPSLVSLTARGVLVTAGAGVQFSELLDFTVQKGLSGLEWAGGLPGTVGGAVRGNAGAFRGETKDMIQEVISLDTKSPSCKITKRSYATCRFGYRTSVFKQDGNREVILSATFRLKPGDPKTIREAVEAKIRYRKERHPLEYPNIGSIFKNVAVTDVPKKHLAKLRSVVKQDPFPVVPVAYLISEAGLKGVSFGGAMISPKHPNFIVNILNAKASDVKTLIALVKDKVKKRFGIQLEEEIIYI